MSKKTDKTKDQRVAKINGNTKRCGGFTGCGGSGWIGSMRCGRCGGTGRRPR